MDFTIIPISLDHVQGFHHAVDLVARERQYLAFLEGPPIEMTTAFVTNNIMGHWPHFVAIHNNKVIGWCDITSLERQAYIHSGELGMGVIKDFRGHGVGNALLKTTLDTAKKLGLTRIELSVREHNKRAIELYQKFGFNQEGLHINAICIDGIYENQLSMALLWEKHPK